MTSHKLLIASCVITFIVANSLLVRKFILNSSADDLASPEDPTVVTNQPLYVEKSALDFGTVWSTNSYKWKIPVKNISSGPIRLSPQAYCHCTEITPKVVDLVPNQSVEFDVKLDLNTTTIPNSETTVGRDFGAGIALNDASTGEEIVSFAVTGKVRDAFFISDDLYMTFPEFERTPLKILRIAVPVPVIQLSASSDNEEVEVWIEEAKSDKIQRRIEIKPRSNLKTGKHSITITIHATLAESRESLVYPITFQVIKQSDIVCLPSRLIIPAFTMQSDCKVTLRSLSNTPFTLTNINSPPDTKSICESLGKPIAKHDIRLVADNTFHQSGGTSVLQIELTDSLGRRRYASKL